MGYPWLINRGDPNHLLTGMILQVGTLLKPCLQAIYANDSWLSTQKRIRMSDINRFMGLRPYPGKPAGGKVQNLNEIAMVWGNPQYLDEETQTLGFFCSNTLAAHRLRANQPLHIRNAWVKLSMCS